jgi:outer membrane protein assembly factor BamE
MRYFTLLLLALICVACGSYSSNVPSIKPYKMDIQQGNVITPKMMMQLHPGMTKSQVRFIMGTPLLVDSFHSDRWDYFYQMRKEGKIIEQRRVILQFQGDALNHVSGDVVPAGTNPSSMPAAPAGKTVSEPKSISRTPKEKEKGLLDKLKFWGNDEQETSREQPKPAEPAKSEPKPEPQPEPKIPVTSQPLPAIAPVTKEEPLPPLIDEAQQAKPVETKATETKPAVKQDQPQKPSAPQEEQKGLLDKLKFWGKDNNAEPKAAPEPNATPEPKPTPVAKPAEPPKAEPARVEPKPLTPAPVETPAPKSKPPLDPKPKATPQDQIKPAPKPADLPPEDAPDFFEKMLEKIGF